MAVRPVFNADLPRTGRRLRRPSHTWQVRARPYQIQPVCIAPVLPGETMKNFLFQARAVSDPIKNPLIGWWKEYYWFYVKHRDLDQRDHFTAMMLNASYDLSPVKSTTGKVETYFAANTAGAIDWVQKCLERVTKCYFRDEPEAWNVAMLSNLPEAKAYTRDSNWLDNLTMDLAMPDIDPNDTSQQQLTPQEAMYEYLRTMTMTDMSYEDWLATYGINKPKFELNEPELLRFVRQWQYPSNTINPTDGAPSSALSWSIQERADKDRFFREPGFIFGVTVTRPKVYMSRQVGAAAMHMRDAMSWLPALMWDTPETSLQLTAFGQGALPALTEASSEGYWVDVRDLLLYGDQFVNFALSATDANIVALPTLAGAQNYVSTGDIDALFKNVASNLIREDGRADFAILGAQQDHT